MSLRRRIVDWLFGRRPDSYVAPPTATEDAVSKEYVDGLWNGYFLPPSGLRPGAVDRRGTKEKFSGVIATLPAGTYDTGPSSQDVKDSGIGILYEDSDRPGFLPTGHYYLFLDAAPVTVIRDMIIDEDGMSIYLSSWNRYGRRVTFEEEDNG